MKKMIGAFVLAGLMMGATSVVAADGERMTYDEYLVELAKYEQCEQENKAKGEALKAEIDGLKAEAGQLSDQIDQTWDEIYAACSTNEAGANSFAAEIEALRDQMMNLNDMTAEQLVERPENVQAMEDQLNGLLANPLSKLSENSASLSELQRILDAMRSRMMRAARGWYDVVRGDHLWKISGKEKVYSDPYQWTRLYSANQDQISDPDLIYPQQRLAVPRMTESGKYTVLKGDSFVSIAEKIYGDATRWRRIQEANVSLLDKMGGLYPGMILVLP